MILVNAASIRRAAVVLAASAVVSLAVGQAHAQDKALAESLFNAGKSALEAGDYKTACKNFTESQKQDPSVGTLLNLGRCNELQGRLATAWGHYKEAARFAQLRSDPERAEAARKLASELEPKLSKLTVTAEAPVPGLVVARIRKDGGESERVEMAGGALGVPLDVDAGQYVIEASAPGYTTWSGEVTLGKDADKQTVTIPALVEAPADQPVPVPGATPSAAAGDDGGGDGSGLVTAGLIVGGVGVVGIGLGAIFGIMASSTASGAEDDPALCPNKQCTAAGLEEIDSAESSATISTIGFGVGAAALAGGAVLLVLGLSQDGGDAPQTGAITIDPVASHEGGGVWINGAF